MERSTESVLFEQGCKADKTRLMDPLQTCCFAFIPIAHATAPFQSVEKEPGA